ncbi:MAG TPA: Ppx/GppA phosphatase family protein [Candidatus Eisenbacteria bacterium]|nr:Ppx/GppA phosphatase family protein [Candidatus Eisenbacteria bacterium]
MPSTKTSKTKFPIRCAGMDVGSNAFRLVIAEFKSPTKYKVLDRMRVPVRLGDSVFRSQRIDDATMEAALDAFRQFREKMEEYEVVLHRAVATSATREAKNRGAFLERVHAETGLELEMIQGTEEARLVALGVRSKLAVERGLSMILDVGGGSSEIAILGHGEILVVESHDVGGVRLLERAGEGPPERVYKMVRATLDSSRFPILDFFKRRPLTRLVGTGGNIEALAEITSSNGSKNGASKSNEDREPARVTLPRLTRMLGQLSKLEPEERAKEYDLRPDRADVIVPAGAIFEYVAKRVRAKEIWVPFVGLVDGVLIDVARAARAEGKKELEVSQTRNSVLAIMKKYDVEPKHANRVSALAISLFDQLKSMHGLGKRDRLLLELAALLHEVGNFISAPGHHRHSYYIISQSPILGVTDSELRVVANVARYHRKAPPDASHEAYAELSSKDQDRVRLLAAILRVADALDHDHRQRVGAVRVKQRGSELRLKVRTKGDVSLDEWSVKDKGDLFEQEFGLKPVVGS